MSRAESSERFSDLGLLPDVLTALNELGYEQPTPIQAATIAPLLKGRNVLGQAQTGTGKTAAFALPVLSTISPGNKTPRALVLAPTRELAIQVAEAFQSYAKHIKGFRVLPIYGGQSYAPQLKALKRGVDVVVGTPGRVMDHIKRGTLKLDALDWLVLDEADEMLQMGFIEDVEWVFDNTPPTRQVALFSATMPNAIRRIAQTYLDDAEEVTIKSKTTTATNIRQRYWLVGGGISKLEALTRVLEAEPFDAAIIFARTKKETEELADKIAARGYACVALNGDIAQIQRERTIGRLKKKQIDIIVATDVAARGLDVERITHVINYDIPHDPEAYVHRIGRTGRAGRSGDAILFVKRREKRLFKAIERTTGKTIEPMDLPSIDEINSQRVERFKEQITEQLEMDDNAVFKQLIRDYQAEHNADWLDLTAVLAKLAQDDMPLFLDAKDKGYKGGRFDDKGDDKGQKRSKKGKRKARDDSDKVTYRIAVGRKHKVRPSNIVGAIANEAGIDSQYIGRINIREKFSLVDLPKGMPKEVFEHLQGVMVAGRKLNISLDKGPKRKKR